MDEVITSIFIHQPQIGYIANCACFSWIICLISLYLQVQKIHEVIESINNQKRILSRELLQITSTYIRSLDTVNDSFVQKLILHGIRPLAQFSNQNYTSKFIEFMRTSKFDESICLCHRVCCLCVADEIVALWRHGFMQQP